MKLSLHISTAAAKKLKKYVKPVLIGMGALVTVAAAGVLVFVNLNLTDRMIETTLSNAVQEQLRRKLVMRELDVGMFRGIRLRGVQIGKSLAWESEDLFTCDEIDIDVGFWPMLFKKLVIRGISLENPRLNLQAAGGRPFSMIGSGAPVSGGAPDFELLFLPGSLLIRGGSVALSDTREKTSFELTDIRLDAGSISYILPFDFTASASFAGSSTQDVQVTGSGNVPARKLSLKLSVPDADVSRFRQLLEPAGIALRRGTAALELTASGRAGSPVALGGKLVVKGAEIELLPPQKADDEIAMTGLGAELNIQAEYDIDSGDTDIKKISGRLLSSPFEGSGSIRAAGQVSLHLLADRLSLDELTGAIAYGQASPFKGLRLSGLVGLAVDMSGAPGRAPAPIVTLKLNDNRIIYPALGALQPALSGTLTFDSSAVTLSSLRFGTKSLGIVLAGTVANYLLWPPQADIRVVSSDLNFYELFTSPDTQKGEDVGPFDFGQLKFEGPIELGNVSFLNLDLTGVKGSYLFEKSKFGIRDFSGGIKQGGTFNLSTGVDLSVKGFDYGIKLSINDVPVQILGDLAGADLSRFIDGNATGSAAVSARGTSTSTFTESLSGGASLKIAGCRIRGIALPEQLERYLKSDALTQLNFSDADVQLRLRNGAVELTSSFISPLVELHPEGWIGLNGQLDIVAQLKLSQDAFSPETKIAEYLPREGSWVVLPVAIKGPADNPDIRLTEETIRQIIQETLPKLLLDMVEKSRARGAGAKPAEQQ